MADTSNKPASVFSTSTTLSLLSETAAAAYLERIQLPASLLSASPSLELLAQLQLASLLNVPFDTTILHVPGSAWNGDPLAPVVLGAGDAMPLGQGAFDQIVRDHRGGYCFSLNSTFAAFLRVFGFRVSELAARVYGALGKDPEEAGLLWGPTSHECLVVDWETDGVRSERYFVDVGFGSGQSNTPLLLDDPNQTFSQAHRILRNPGVPLPPSSVPLFPDTTTHYILSRLAFATPTSRPYWTPLYTFPLLNAAAPDFVVYNHYNSTHPSAAFTRFLVCSKVLEGGKRRSIYYKEGMRKEGEVGEWAKLVTVGGGLAKEEESVEWVRMRVGDLKEVLEREFGMVFRGEE